MSEKCRELLLTFGWYPERRISTTNFVDYLQSENAPILQSQLLIYAEFGELKFHFDDMTNNKFKIYQSFVSFEINEIRGLHNPELVSYQYEPRVKNQLGQVGMLLNWFYGIFTDENGKIYFGVDDNFGFVADNIYLALEKIFFLPQKEYIIDIIA